MELHLFQSLLFIIWDHYLSIFSMHRAVSNSFSWVKPSFKDISTHNIGL